MSFAGQNKHNNREQNIPHDELTLLLNLQIKTRST